MMELPTFDSLVRSMALAERHDGWLSKCQNEGRFLVLNEEMVGALGQFLRTLCGVDSVLEVCAGTGRLAEALASVGVRTVATDIAPPAGSTVDRASAPDALDRWRPAVVLASFVPFDSGVDSAVLSAASVEHYVVLNSRLGGQLGSGILWAHPDWIARPLPRISRWMICRHDVWIDPLQPILQHGETWHLSRKGHDPDGTDLGQDSG